MRAGIAISNTRLSDARFASLNNAGSAGPDESFDAVVFVADAGSASESIRCVFGVLRGC